MSWNEFDPFINLLVDSVGNIRESNRITNFAYEQISIEFQFHEKVEMSYHSEWHIHKVMNVACYPPLPRCFRKYFNLSDIDQEYSTFVFGKIEKCFSRRLPYKYLC